MSEDQINNEADDNEKQIIRVKQALPSWISMVQSKIISQNESAQQSLEEKQETHLGLQSERTERNPLCQSGQGSSVFFREDFGKSNMADFDPSLNKYRTQPHEVHFRYKIFLKFLTVRLLFTIVGPLMLIVGVYKNDWTNFIINFRVYGLSIPVVLNYCRWLSNYYFIFAFIRYLEENSVDTVYYEIAFMILVYLTENVTYAIKYAFFHPSKVNLYEKQSSVIIGDSCEQSINPIVWAKQVSSLIEKELELSMKRLQIEPTCFLIYFMVAPNPERYERIKVFCGNDQLQNKMNLLGDEKKLFEKNAGDGVRMAKEIINNFNQNCDYRVAIKISFLLSIFRVTAYILTVQLCKQQSQELYLLIPSCIIQFIYFFFVLSLMMIFYRDLKRKVFCMTQLSHLISAEKVEVYQEQKLFPTLNLLCIASLHTWFNLRKMLLDYGLQYTRRQSFMLSFIVIVHTLMMAVTMFLFYTHIISFGTLISSTIDFIIIISIFIALVLQGARINAHWCVHRGLLRKNLFLIQQLSSQIFKSFDYNFKPQDPVFAALQKIIELSHEKGVIYEDSLLNYSMFCINSISKVYDDLGHQECSQPYTVVGIAMTYDLLLQVCISALGLIGTACLNFILQLKQ